MKEGESTTQGATPPLLPASTNDPILVQRVFETVTINAKTFPSQSNKGTVSINVNVVTQHNKHLLPRFTESGFEFFSLTQSTFFQNGQFSKSDFQEMLDRVAGPRSWTGTKNNEEPILKAIVKEFADRYHMKVRIRNTFMTGNAGSAVTEIHTDDPGTLRLWIPVTTTFIDNLCLGVGREAMDANPDQIDWYQQLTMSSEDWIFFHGTRVHHYSANRGKTLQTQKRRAFVVELDYGYDTNQHRDINYMLEYR